MSGHSFLPFGNCPDETVLSGRTLVWALHSQLECLVFLGPTFEVG